MQFPLEIAFHNLDKPDWAEAEIRSRVDKLDTIYERLTGCRVRVERRANRGGQRGSPPVVRVEMSVPGYKDLVVAYEPRRLQERFQDPDLKNAIHDAFDTAERRLIDFKRKREGHHAAVAQSHVDEQLLGQVAEMPEGEDHGFLLNNVGSLLYFHRNSVLNTDFDALKPGDKVHYVEAIGDTGPTAEKVRLA